MTYIGNLSGAGLILQSQYVGGYSVSMLTTATSAGSTYFQPSQGDPNNWILKTIVSIDTGSNAVVVTSYNVTSGTYVHIGGPGITALSTSNTTPTILQSVNLVNATNFNRNDGSIYELQYYGSGVGPTSVHYGSEILRI